MGLHTNQRYNVFISAADASNNDAPAAFLLLFIFGSGYRNSGQVFCAMV